MKLLAFLLLFVTTSAFAVQSYKVDPDLYADPIPTSITYPLMDAKGIKPEQRSLFTVVRLVPLELGGTNAKDNLIIVSHRDAFYKRNLDLIVLGKVQHNLMTADAAVKMLTEWRP